MTTLFISDVHVDAAQPAITRRLLQFLEGEARTARALYILGDLFESWIGDDAADPDQQQVIAALRTLTDTGTTCFVLHGNRDFLLGPGFSEASGAQLLPDPLLLTLYGKQVLVMHGDALCTDDVSYQRLRATVRDADWQRRFRSLSLPARRTLASAARAGSQDHTAGLEYKIADANQDSVATVLRAAGVNTLLHGHTHRPAIHRFTLDGRECTRIVLGDWYTQGSVLRWDERGYELAGLTDSASVTASAGVPE
ncbi:MAG: UDP-2,3-diacylglucosamine diphosphatase [Proteobacteria bacterium]|nr:UDP-2,3-diacylglucosamine diphosphatase [Pseudomonadota bacterium]